MKGKKIIVIVGFPSSGKSTYAKKLLSKYHKNGIILSRDINKINGLIRGMKQYLINHKKTGIFHLGSTDVISHFDFIGTLIERRHNTSGIYKQVFTSNTMRYLATLPKENKLPHHLQPSYTDILDDLSLR